MAHNAFERFFGKIKKNSSPDRVVYRSSCSGDVIPLRKAFQRIFFPVPVKTLIKKIRRLQPGSGCFKRGDSDPLFSTVGDCRRERGEAAW